jgi:hypothetical protein
MKEATVKLEALGSRILFLSSIWERIRKIYIVFLLFFQPLRDVLRDGGNSSFEKLEERAGHESTCL